MRAVVAVAVWLIFYSLIRETETQETIPVDPKCHKTKGCFYRCVNSTDCDVLVTWTPDDNHVQFEVSKRIYNTQDVWVAIGLSIDQHMPNTSVTMCVSTQNEIKAYSGFNPDHYFEFLSNETLGLETLSGKLENNILTCKFNRAIKADNPQFYSLANQYFLLVANSTVTVNGTNIKPDIHTTTPYRSDIMIDFLAVPKDDFLPLDSECHKTKGCFYQCEDEDHCAFVVSWVPEEQYVNIEISRLFDGQDDRWIALGISYDQQMPNTSVTMCLFSNESSIVSGFNQDYSFNVLPNSQFGIIPLNNSRHDRILRCSFKRKMLENNDKFFNITSGYYLLVANGTIESGIPRKHSLKPVFSEKKIDMRYITTIPNDPECGKSKGCFSNCSNDECAFLISWVPKNETVLFDVYASSIDTELYMAVGFSYDEHMPNTSISICIASNNSVDVFSGHAPGYYFNFLSNKTLGVELIRGSNVDGIFHCSFTREVQMDYNDFFSLNDDLFLFLARGKLNQTGYPQKHSSTPYKSTIKYNLTEDHFEPVTTMVPIQTTIPNPGGGLPYDKLCGITKGCFYECDDDKTKCKYLITWQKQSEVVQFKINVDLSTMGDIGQSFTNRWTAIGFNKQAEMVGAKVTLCKAFMGAVTTEFGENVDSPDKTYNPSSNKTRGIRDYSGNLTDNFFYCTFQLWWESRNDNVIKFNETWYLLFASGDTDKDGNVDIHNYKVVSDNKINFENFTSNEKGEEGHLPIKVHGALMIVTWTLLSSTGIILARFYKNVWLSIQPCGLRLWFQLHRSIMLSVLVLTVTSIIIIYLHVGTFLKEVSTNRGYSFASKHGIMGITVGGLTILNPVMAVFRCKPEDEHRFIFDKCHYFVGSAAALLGGITLNFGFFLKNANAPVDCSYIFYAFVVVIFVEYIILEINRRKLPKQVPDIKSLSSYKNLEKSPEIKENNSFLMRLLALHFIIVIPLAFAMVVFFCTG